MSFYKFQKDDILNIKVATRPSNVVENNGNNITGSVYLENKYLNSDLLSHLYLGFSQREGGLVLKTGPFTSSVEFLTAVNLGTNKETFSAINNLYRYYSTINAAYSSSYNGTFVNTIRIFSIPEVYYDRQIVSGTFSASFIDTDGGTKVIFDNGRGGLYSGSLTGTLVGHIFYPEGIVSLTKPDLVNFGADNNAANFKWRVVFKGDHTIPVQVYRCRAPAGQLNASTNPSFYTVSATGSNKNEKEILATGSVYITQVGLYNEDYELVGVANLAQPIKKDEDQDILFRLKMDY